MPEGGGHGHIPHGANEADHGNQWADESVLDGGKHAMVLQEEVLPEGFRHQDREGAGNHEADDQLVAQHAEIHDRVAGSVRPAARIF